MVCPPWQVSGLGWHGISTTSRLTRPTKAFVPLASRYCAPNGGDLCSYGRNGSDLCSIPLEPLAAHVRRTAQVIGRPFKYDLAMAHYVDPLRDAHGDGELLLDQQHRDALGADGANHLGDDLYDLRCQALC